MDDAIRIAERWYVLATSSRTDDRTRVLKHGDTFGVFDRFGDVHPIGTGEHADRFVTWFNDCAAFLLEQPNAVATDVPSFFKLLRGG